MPTVLVISPHPDDEAIGCGGAIGSHVISGDSVEVIFLTSGEKGGHGRSESDTISIREKEARVAAEILNISSIEFWHEPDGRLYANSENIRRLSEKIRQTNPSIVYVPHLREQHPDHVAAAHIVLKAIATLETGFSLPSVLMYEVWTPIQEIDHVLDISDFMDTKIKAIQAYQSQCSVLKFDEAVIGLNRYRGEMHSWPGGDYAEVFCIPDLSVNPLVKS